MTRHSLVSLFAGCGGFDLGFIKAGFDVVWANDFYVDAVQTYKNNIGDHIYCGDITKIHSENIPNNFDVLTGGFPCQGFSIANSKRSMADERNFLYKEILRILTDKKPKIFVVENVKGLLSMDGGKVFDMILSDFKKIGYNVDYRILKASDFGVPQNRERVIIIGNLLNIKNIFPIPTHAPPQQKYTQDMLDHISVKESIGFLADVRVRQESFFLDTLEIHNHIARTNIADTFWGREFDVKQEDVCDFLKEWRKKTNISVKQIDKMLGYTHTAGHWFRKDNKSGSIPNASDWWELKKILGFDDTFDQRVTSFVKKKIVFEQSLRVSNWDTPSDTITASGPEIHPNRNRRLSVRECALLQSFPLNFKFTGGISSMYRQIGNAVPPLLAYEMAINVKKML